jgi:hypothetical protein
MTPEMLLTQLTARGIEFQIRGDKLRFRPLELLTASEVNAVRQHKLVLLKFLAAADQQVSTTCSGKHDVPDEWVYTPDKYKRVGWRTVHCKFCQTFIGYLRPQKQATELRKEVEPCRPATGHILHQVTIGRARQVRDN